MRPRVLWTYGMLAAGVAVVFALSLVIKLEDPDRMPPIRPRLGEPFLSGSSAVRTVSGEKLDLRSPDAGATAVVFYSMQCPRSAEVLPELVAWARARQGEDHLVVGVCVDALAKTEQVRAHAESIGATFAVVHDRTGEVASRFRAKATPEAFVLVDDGRLCYRGSPADDRETLGSLRHAVEAVISGNEPTLAHREPTGSPLPSITDAATSPPTFSDHIEPILRRSCTGCHQEGHSGPFPLTSYRQAAKRAGDIASVVEQRLMPPWKPTSGVGPPLRHDRTLLPEEIAAIRAWSDAGAPEGSPTVTAPASSATTEGWSLGTPDLVLEMPEEFAIPASGEDLYRCFVLPTDLPADAAITAIEVKPGNPRVVHHTFAYIDVRGLGRSRDREDPGPGYMCFSGFTGDSIFGALGGWTPGNEPHPFGDGIGLNLPRGADVVLQVHYHPSGKPERDRTRLGLHFAKKPIRQALQWVSACDDPAEFFLPAGRARIDLETRLTLPMDVDLHAITPHMHLLGKTIRAFAEFPDGRTRPLIAIEDWDFNRQDTYYLREPLRLPEGTTIRIESTYDNSAGNPRNPSSPPRDVMWGEATTDDMLILFLGLTQAGQDLTKPGAKDTFMEDFFRRAGVLPEENSGD